MPSHPCPTPKYPAPTALALDWNPINKLVILIMTEHILDRLDRLNIKYHVVSEDENGVFLRNSWLTCCGKQRYRGTTYHENPTTWLRTCDLCGKISTPKKIQYRSNEAYWNWHNKKDYGAKRMGTLCMSCWNKVRPLVKQEETYEKTRLLINKLNRERLICQKLQTQDN